MTSQTVVIGFALRVAVHTPFHRHLHQGSGGWPFALPDISMTGFTFNPGQNHMATVGEEDIIGLPIKPVPGNFFAVFLKLPDLFFIRMVGKGILVAFHADCHFWHSREGLFLKMGMAGMALDALLVMFFMVERDGLFRPET